MPKLQISELARRSGFPPTTLRYYEDIGVLPPPSRSRAGYRLYDDDALERLVFVRRAKSLGLSLDEVIELLVIRDEGACAPLHDRLTRLLDDRIATIELERAELATLAEQLIDVRERLTGNEPPERCGSGCGCNEELEAPAQASDQVFVVLGQRKPDVPIACTLDEPAARAQAEEWKALANAATRRIRTEQGLRMEFPPDVGLSSRVAELAAREARCCEFLTFVVHVDRDGIQLDVEAPPDARVQLDGLFNGHEATR